MLKRIRNWFKDDSNEVLLDKIDHLVKLMERQNDLMIKIQERYVDKTDDNDEDEYNEDLEYIRRHAERIRRDHTYSGVKETSEVNEDSRKDMEWFKVNKLTDEYLKPYQGFRDGKFYLSWNLPNSDYVEVLFEGEQKYYLRIVYAKMAIKTREKHLDYELDSEMTHLIKKPC